MQTPAYRSPWALTILSLLFERPMHPYEMRRLARERGKDEHVDLRPGSLYRTIERLERARLVEPVETTREGRFPERTVYQLTPHGREELQDWMRELLSTPMKEFPQFLHALSVLPVLEPDDALSQLEKRVLYLEGELAAMETRLRRLDGLLPRLFVLEEEYAMAQRRSELEWVKGIIGDIRTGRLTWSQEQLKEEFGHLSAGQPVDLRIVDTKGEVPDMA
ncbi:MAG TPA: PadR family transcriptional regulator [Candidatus Dormibacteraeota bacterium]|nr:PadR family transcriptional regulator [Candidatus Dormibacteraeota bacterium]